MHAAAAAMRGGGFLETILSAAAPEMGAGEEAALLAGSFLPGMPADPLAMAQKVLGGRWYRCPNGHAYYVDKCGRPTVVNKCATCGVPGLAAYLRSFPNTPFYNAKVIFDYVQPWSPPTGEVRDTDAFENSLSESW